jgi:hypothetical protein
VVEILVASDSSGMSAVFRTENELQQLLQSPTGRSCAVPQYGRLKVHAVKAKNLKNMQIFGSMDPYLKLSLQEPKFSRSKARPRKQQEHELHACTQTDRAGGTHPYWNRELNLDLQEASDPPVLYGECIQRQPTV